MELEGADIDSGCAVVVAIDLAREARAALVRGHSAGDQGVASGVDGRAAEQEPVRFGRPTVVLQWAEFRVGGDGADQPDRAFAFDQVVAAGKGAAANVEDLTTRAAVSDDRVVQRQRAVEGVEDAAAAAAGRVAR